jgi:hypothetical protein
LKHYYNQPFSEEDLYRIPQDAVGQSPSVYQLPRTDNAKKVGLGSGHKPYSIWSAAKYILMISLMLYWLPLVGQMIGGFIGGRRAGSPLRAIIAALLPVIVLYSMSTALNTGIIPIRFQNATLLTYVLIKDALEKLPIASPYVSFATTYVGSFINELKTAASFKVGNYFITIAFAYVGGILSDQSRRELEYVSRFGAPTTNILVSGRDGGQQSPRQHINFARPLGMLRSFIPSRRRGPYGFDSMTPISPSLPPGGGGGYAANSMGTLVPSRGRFDEMRAAPYAGYAPPAQYARNDRYQPQPNVPPWQRANTAGVIPRENSYRRGNTERARQPVPREAQNAPGRMYAGAPKVKLYRATQGTDMPSLRKDRIKAESTRKLVERALGKDYFKSPGNKAAMHENHIQARTAGGSFTAPSALREEKKTAEWDLL